MEQRAAQVFEAEFEQGEAPVMREEAPPKAQGWFLSGIAHTLGSPVTAAQGTLCLLMMALLSLARLPLGGYACQAAMFAVLLRQGSGVLPAFAGAAAGFALRFAQGDLLGCWQMAVCAGLWLSAGIWARGGRMAMAAAVFAAQLSALALTGLDTPLALLVPLLSAAMGAGLCVLYDGAALVLRHRDELDGETRPLCIMAVFASLAAGIMQLPYGEILAGSLALYLTLEHAYVGGASQAILCAGVLGGVVSLGQGSAHTAAMLLCGGFLAGEIKTRYRSACLLLQLCGMGAACALLGGDLPAIRLLVILLPGALPFLVLSSARRAPVTGLIERTAPQEMTQSEAIAVRCAAMIHSWANLYGETARMMQGLSAAEEESPLIRPCVDLLEKTSAAAHQVCERTLSEIRPDDEAYRRLRYALLREGMEQVRPAYALRMGGRMEALLLKPEHVAPVTLEKLVSSACGAPMRAGAREGLLSTQAVFEQAPALALEIGVAMRSRSGEAVAGDSYVSRPLPGGRHVLALSDGMGSGAGAMQESQTALRLMVESLRSGYTRAQALDVVNALMLLCTGREMYATMDLCICDLHTGETAFEKLGACASYVVREGEVRALQADTLPVGVLPEVESRSLRMTLRPGDVVILMTDGVSGAYPGGEAALQADIAKVYWLHPQAVGEKLIAKALDGGAAKDDMAVLCARVARAVSD